MPRHEIEVSRTAEKQLRKLPGADRERLARRMMARRLRAAANQFPIRYVSESLIRRPLGLWVNPS